jgi:hypothetical protein
MRVQSHKGAFNPVMKISRNLEQRAIGFVFKNGLQNRDGLSRYQPTKQTNMKNLGVETFSAFVLSFLPEPVVPV